MASAAPRGALRHLRQALATLDKDKGFSLVDEELLPLGLPGVDAALGGGLACAALHEIAPAAPAQLGTAAGFALALLLASCCAGAAFAGQAPPAGPAPAAGQPPPPVVEKFVPKTDSQREAFGLMKDMANYLSNLSAFSFNSTNSFDVVQQTTKPIPPMATMA